MMGSFSVCFPTGELGLVPDWEDHIRTNKWPLLRGTGAVPPFPGFGPVMIYIPNWRRRRR